MTGGVAWSPRQAGTAITSPVQPGERLFDFPTGAGAPPAGGSSKPIGGTPWGRRSRKLRGVDTKKPPARGPDLALELGSARLWRLRWLAEQRQQLVGRRAVGERQWPEQLQIQRRLELHAHPVHVLAEVLAAHHSAGHAHAPAIGGDERQLAGGIHMQVLAVKEAHAPTAQLVTADRQVGHPLVTGENPTQQHRLPMHAEPRLAPPVRPRAGGCVAGAEAGLAERGDQLIVLRPREPQRIDR